MNRIFRHTFFTYLGECSFLPIVGRFLLSASQLPGQFRRYNFGWCLVRCHIRSSSTSLTQCIVVLFPRLDLWQSHPFLGFGLSGIRIQGVSFDHQKPRTTWIFHVFCLNLSSLLLPLVINNWNENIYKILGSNASDRIDSYDILVRQCAQSPLFV